MGDPEDLYSDEGRRPFLGPGGTPGGYGSFLVGLALAGIGVFLLARSLWALGVYPWVAPGRHGNGFGFVFAGLALAVGLLFYSASNFVGWVLMLGAGGTLVALVVMSPEVFLGPPPL